MSMKLALMISWLLKGNCNRQSFEKCCAKYEISIKVKLTFSLQATATISPRESIAVEKGYLSKRDIVAWCPPAVPITLDKKVSVQAQ